MQSARSRIVQDLRAAFGHRLRELREQAKLSQEQLAERADLHWTYVSGIERGRRNPGLNTLGRLAAALSLSMAELLAGVGEEKFLASASRPRPGRGRVR